MSNYPAGYSGEEGEEEETYIIELGGEVKVQGYNEEDADNEFRKNLAEYLVTAFQNGERREPNEPTIRQLFLLTFTKESKLKRRSI